MRFQCRSRFQRLPLALLLGAALVAPAALHAGSASTGPVLREAAAKTYSPPKYRFVQANLKAGTPVRKFQADVRTVLGTNPDFVTYNEVPRRHDSVLAPGKYAIWRTPGQYKGATPVVWNSKRWKLLRKGTFMVSNKHGKTKKQRAQLGIRYANWVTLRNRTGGRVLSVVSAHIAPYEKPVKGLLRPSLRRLDKLADKLDDSGPVLIGGDFNVPYNGGLYPRGQLYDERFVPTYDVLQRREVTGDHHGATIDYLFLRGAAKFSVSSQSTRTLNSDHNALVVDLCNVPTGGTADSSYRFGNGTVQSEPNGPRSGQRVLLRVVQKAVNSAPKGAAIHLATHHLESRGIVTALRKAYARGVHVQLITGDSPRTGTEESLARLLGSNVNKKSWAVNRPNVWPSHKEKLPPSVLLVSRTGKTPAFRLDAPYSMIPETADVVVRLQLRTSRTSYDRLFRPFFAVVGRKV
ncbi:endonuclease/exonuclease/phosphatase family protein [Nocardioides cheoyonin]|uniref:endonuclease/exonuclease/phosphatase family protein n=1 Tax=Nocardioides cheoyonin TaxID=3156615 RepID=UPI0032B4AB92